MLPARLMSQRMNSQSPPSRRQIASSTSDGASAATARVRITRDSAAASSMA